MTFFRIEMLFFIWAVPVLLVLILFGMRRRREILQRFSSAHGLKTIVPDRVDGRRWIKGILLMGTVLFTAVSLAGPKYGYRWKEIRQRGVDIVIALDCSRSMTAADIAPTRLERAKREVFDLLAMLQGDRVGLVAFAGTAFLQCPLTLDYNAFNLFLNTLSPDYLPVGGTDITSALKTASNSFDPKSATDKAVILITDGENTGAGDPLKAAELLNEKKIKLFCIGVGSSEGVPIPEASGGFKKDRAGQIVLSRLDENTLKKIAVITGGTYVRSVAGDMDLDAIYKDEIRSKMEAETLTSGRKQIWEDRFQWPLVLALLCLIAELMLPVTRKTVVTSLMVALMILPVCTARASDTRDGITAYEKGDFDAALKHFTEAQIDAPDSPEMLYNVANAYYKTGNFDAAVDHYRQVLETDDTRLKQNVLYNLGNAEFRRGHAKEAIGHYETALTMDPDNRLAKENLAFVKKTLEEQQQQTDQDKNQQDSVKENQDQENESASGSNRNDQSGEQKRQQDNRAQDDQQNRQRPEFEDEMDRQQSQQATSPNSQQNQQPPAAQSQMAESDDQTADPGQAERMLNRLQDQPGRALMPARGNRTVEKDW